MLNITISYCGLNCQTCTIFLASKETDTWIKEKMIFDIMHKCKEVYGIKYKFEEINDCDGCKSNTGKLFFGCSDCKIRECAIHKGLENCAPCNAYPCEKLLEVFRSDPEAKVRLDEIRNTLKIN